MKLELPSIVTPVLDHKVERFSIGELAPNADVDLAYYDPPYGSNNDKMPPSRVRYASYYHVWKTICLNDRPALFGKANRRADCSDRIARSQFEDFRRDSEGRFVAVEAIRRLLNSTKARYIILSYSSGGRATSQELNEAIGASGRLIEVVEVDYRRNVMGGMTWSNEWLRDAQQPNREFLFLIER
jgi:adenine-specific DNA-methyltransferase